MKKLFVSVLFVAVSIGVFTSCNKDDGYDDYVGIEFRLRNEDFGEDKIFLFEMDSVSHQQGGSYPYYYDYWEPCTFYIKISSSNNFYIYAYPNSYGMNNAECSIACVGSVKGLGNIKTIPSSGWAREVAVHPGMGYIIRCKNFNPQSKWLYARVYVKDWIESTDGGIIGAIIKYQTDWNVE